jgi:hypothetical protein
MNDFLCKIKHSFSGDESVPQLSIGLMLRFSGKRKLIKYSLKVKIFLLMGKMVLVKI